MQEGGKKKKKKKEGGENKLTRQRFLGMGLQLMGIRKIINLSSGPNGKSLEEKGNDM